MRVSIDVEAGVWSAFLMRCHEEGLDPDQVITAWLKRATRQEKSVLPGTESPRPKVVEMKR